MIKLMTAPVIIEDIQEAIRGYMEAGKFVPQSVEEFEAMMLTVWTKKEFDRANKCPAIPTVVFDELTKWAECPIIRAWTGDCYYLPFIAGVPSQIVGESAPETLREAEEEGTWILTSGERW